MTLMEWNPDWDTGAVTEVVQLLLDWRRHHLDTWDRALGVHLRHAPARMVRAG
jgi:hypothetical protein